MGSWRLQVVLFLVGTAAQAAPDASVELEEMPRSTEHRALEKQVLLMRAEVAKPRDWFDREKADRLKTELAGLERALNRVEAIYLHKMDACRLYYLRNGRDPNTLGVDPGYFDCFRKPPVDDDTVRAVRRREEVLRRLQDRGMAPAARETLKTELRVLETRLDREEGLEPLYLGTAEPDVDGGQAPVPQPAPPGRKP